MLHVCLHACVHVFVIWPGFRDNYDVDGGDFPINTFFCWSLSCYRKWALFKCTYVAIEFSKKDFLATSACVYVRTHAHVRVFLGIVNAEQVNQHISIGEIAQLLNLNMMFIISGPAVSPNTHAHTRTLMSGQHEPSLAKTDAVLYPIFFNLRWKPEPLAHYSPLKFFVVHDLC